MFPGCQKKQILWNYDFGLFGDGIHHMNKTRYRNFHVYTEDKIVFILDEERKFSKMNKSSETKKSKYNSSGVVNTVNNNNKESHQKKNTNIVITTIAAIKKSLKCTYCGQGGHFVIKCFKNSQGESYKGKPASSTGR